MGDLQLPEAGFGLLPRDAKRGSRAISRASIGGMVRRTGIDCLTDVSLGKTDSITVVAGAMLGDVTRVAQAQQQFELLAPQASARLNMIADGHAIDLLEQAADHRRALRRL